MSSRLFIILLIFSLSAGLIYCQEDDRIDYNPSKQELDADKLGEAAIILKLKLDTLNIETDSLKKYSLVIGTELVNSKKELLKLVGHTSESLNEFRRKFEETEEKIDNKTGTPSDSRKLYFDEISMDKARCLPEFSDRFISLKLKLGIWEGKDIIAENIEGTYLVKEGDYLNKIALKIFKNEKFWEKIWEANMNGVFNKDELPFFQKKIENPNIIYPGQVLNIPSNK